MANETEDNAPRDVSRRNVFKQVGAVGAAALAGVPFAPSAAVTQGHAARGNPVAAAPLEALETLTAAEADILEAIVARLIPSDQNGPGATEARAAHYIDRALAGSSRLFPSGVRAGSCGGRHLCPSDKRRAVRRAICRRSRCSFAGAGKEHCYGIRP